MDTPNPGFVTRTPPSPSTDYIKMVNDTLANDPAGVDVNSELYQNALSQYNSIFNKGDITRPGIPTGFCGYIDPATGVLRVEPDIADQIIPEEQIYTPIPSDASSLTLLTSSYPVDDCLQFGLAGSPEYTTKITINSDGSLTPDPRNCGADRDLPPDPTEIDWANFYADPIAGVYGKYTMGFYQEVFPQWEEFANAHDIDPDGMGWEDYKDYEEPIGYDGVGEGSGE